MVKGISLDSRFAIVVGLAIWVFARGLFLWKNEKYKLISVKRELLTSVFAFYIIGIISVTLFPFEIYWGEAQPTFGRSLINIVPFIDIFKDFNDNHFSLAFKIKLILKNLIGNFILLLPLGIFVPALYTRFRSLGKMATIGLSVSFFIEISQFILAYLGHSRGRASDIDDLILNTLGTIIGYLFFSKVLARYSLFSQTSINTKSEF